MRTFLRTGLALVLLFAAIPAAGQEQVGAITGVVTDASSALLPGAAIEAVSTAGVRLQTTSDANGSYRFPRVSPGLYTVTAKIAGFTPAEVRNVEVRLGDTVAANFQLEIGEISETISVVGEAGQVDIKSNATTSTISGQQLELLGQGRDFTAIVGATAGASNEGFLGGISIDGASGAENRFIIDGIDTTHPQDGTSGQALTTDFIEEVQVKLAGYQAEFGGSTGGVINAITKSGTNEFRGSVGTYYGESDWDGEERITPYEADPSLYRQFEKDDVTRLQPGFEIGGPIIQDTLWFYGAFQQTQVDIDRQPDNDPATYSQSDDRDFYSLNFKGNVGSQLLYKLSGNVNEREVQNALPAKDGSTPQGTPLGVGTTFPTESYSGYFDYIPTASFFLSARAGYYSTDQEASGLSTSDSRIHFRAGSYPDAGSPLFRPTNFATVPAALFTGASIDLWERTAASLDGNLFVTAAGTHAFKAGVQYEEISNDVINAEVGNYFEVRWGLTDRFGAGTRGTYGSVGVRRFGTFGKVSSENLGFYLQDSWTVLPNLTFNLGVRTEKEDVPNYGHGQDPTLPDLAWSFDYDDKLAPRLGFAWDVFSDQKLKVYGSWGTYYDISKFEMSRGSFGGDRWIQYLYGIETLNWEAFDDGCHVSTNNPSDNPCPGLGTPLAVLDLRHPSDPSFAGFGGVDPDLKPMESEEFQVGADYQITTNSVLGARYVDKSVQVAIEDVGLRFYDADGFLNEVYTTANPGLGIVKDPDGAGPIPVQEKASRDYRAVELFWNRRFANNWSAQVAYTYSQLEGNYSGLASSDEFGRTDPNVSRAFDGPNYTVRGDGSSSSGDLNTDRPHVIDAQFTYTFGFGTTIGLNQYYGSGTPVSEVVDLLGVQFYPNGRGNKGRTDDLTQTDLRVSHEFPIGGFGLELSVQVLNLFDEDTALLIDNNHYRADLCDFLAHCDGSSASLFPWQSVDTDTAMAGADLNPFYLQPNVAGSFVGSPYQAPRTIRAGVKFKF